MSVQSEIDRIITAVGNAYSKVSEKGGTVPASQTVANLATAIGSIPSGAAKETWVIKSDAGGEFATTQISFTSNGQKFTSIGAVYDGSVFSLIYGNNEIAIDPGVGGVYEFYNEAYRKLTFDTPPTGDLLTWLQSNAVKQPDGTAVQDTKALTITSNGTVSVTPDAPYDGLSSVDVTVNVASGGGGGTGFKLTFPATAKNWDKVEQARLVLYDGTFVDIKNYSVIAGQTVNGIIGIQCESRSDYTFYVLKMAIEKGAIALHNSVYVPNTRIWVAQAGESTHTQYGGGAGLFWWPIADTVISAIEMYNTD